MEETYLAKCIVLNSQPFRESDGKKTVYSLEKGKLDLVVRGVKKIKSKLAGHLEPITLSEIMIVRGKSFDYIGGAVSKNCYPRIKSDLDALISAGEAVKSLNRLVKLEEADKEVFFILKNFLDYLEKEAESERRADYSFFSALFNFKLLVILGYQPELYHCAICRKKILPQGNWFDPEKGGLICPACRGNKTFKVIKISDNGIKVLRTAGTTDFETLGKLKVSPELGKEIKNIISAFSQYCL